MSFASVVTLSPVHYPDSASQEPRPPGDADRFQPSPSSVAHDAADAAANWRAGAKAELVAWLHLMKEQGRVIASGRPVDKAAVIGGVVAGAYAVSRLGPPASVAGAAAQAGKGAFALVEKVMKVGAVISFGAAGSVLLRSESLRLEAAASGSREGRGLRDELISAVRPSTRVAVRAAGASLALKTTQVLGDSRPPSLNAAAEVAAAFVRQVRGREPGFEDHGLGALLHAYWRHAQQQSGTPLAQASAEFVVEMTAEEVVDDVLKHLSDGRLDSRALGATTAHVLGSMTPKAAKEFHAALAAKGQRVTSLGALRTDKLLPEDCAFVQAANPGAAGRGLESKGQR